MRYSVTHDVQTSQPGSTSLAVGRRPGDPRCDPCGDSGHRACRRRAPHHAHRRRPTCGSEPHDALPAGPRRHHAGARGHVRRVRRAAPFRRSKGRAATLRSRADRGYDGRGRAQTSRRTTVPTGSRRGPGTAAALPHRSHRYDATTGGRTHAPDAGRRRGGRLGPSYRPRCPRHDDGHRGGALRRVRTVARRRRPGSRAGRVGPDGRRMVATVTGSFLTAARREEDLAALRAGEVVDVLVVGGGITGAGVALDAASRGLTVALVERHDLASGTSRWSSKLVHGGLRYLAQGKVGIAQESARERAILLVRTAPHLVRPIPGVIPL